MTETTSPRERSHSLPAQLSTHQEIRQKVEEMVGFELQLYVIADQRDESDLPAEKLSRLFKQNLVERGVQLYNELKAIYGIPHSHRLKKVRWAMHGVSRLITRKEIESADSEPQIIRSNLDRPPKEQVFALFASDAFEYLYTRVPAVLKRIW